jgi:CheY-like chemotaxis protein
MESSGQTDVHSKALLQIEGLLHPPQDTGIRNVNRISFADESRRSFHLAPRHLCRESTTLELKQNPVLIECSQGVRRMGLVETRRPVVLVVEDELLLRMDAVDMIRAAGFEVIDAGTADEAIEILEARTDITVVFTDIQMPGSMDGLKLAKAVRGRWPPIKIIATSGRVHVAETDLPEGGRFLPKPYSPLEIAGVLRELTGG